MREAREFLAALVRHWIVLLTSSILAVGLLALPAWNRPIPRVALQGVIVLCFLPAAFLAWRDEWRRAEDVTVRLADARSQIDRITIETEVALQVTDNELWVLVATALHGLHKETVIEPNGGWGAVLFLADKPIDPRQSFLLYETVDRLKRKGALKEEGSTLALSDDGKRAVLAAKRLKQKPVRPGPLIDHDSGEQIVIGV